MVHSVMKNSSDIESILQFWFGEIETDFCVDNHNKLWFRGGAVTDAKIRSRFASQLSEALVGKLESWCVTGRGTLALVLLLDQFTRNCFRGSAQAFAGDQQALGIAKAAIDGGLDRQLALIERCFFYAPFKHAECLADQERGVALYAALLEAAPTAKRPVIESYLVGAQQHRDIIGQFGRFPHRNAALNRISTAAESAYLEAGGPRFGQ